MGYNPQLASQMYLLFKDFIANGLDELCDFCQDYYNYAEPSLKNNKAAGLDSFNYASQVPNAVNWLRERAAYLEEELKGYYEKPGDVNYDKEVNIGDITALTDVILGGNVDVHTHRRADVNLDGEITVGDISHLIDLIADN